MAPRSNLTVTVYLAEGQPRTGRHLAPGLADHLATWWPATVAATDLPGATPVDHWYLISGLEVRPARTAAAVVALGDSLTDGRGSTTNGNDRWPDQLSTGCTPTRAPQVAVLNQARRRQPRPHDGLGPNALARLDRDVLAQSGVRWLVVFEGVNDIGTAPATEAAQKRSPTTSSPRTTRSSSAATPTASGSTAPR